MTEVFTDPAHNTAPAALLCPTKPETEDPFETGLISFLPNLTAYARSLTRDVVRAEDLVQDTILKALVNRTKFALGTNQRAWLFTILRNAFLSEMRKGGREIQYDGTEHADPGFHSAPAQEQALQLKEVAREIDRLPSAQRQAVLLVAAQGHSYEDAAIMSSCEVGTIKSRVSRARSALSKALD